ncbi:hypothetical protein MLA71_003392 [Salmonella enterica subsp. enterica serovar Infantis]|nr:hypothetical protein [Salmonella enterica subsp. enterica serovar Infantis]
MKVSQLNYGVLFDTLKTYYEVDDDDSVWEILNQADDPIEEMANVIKPLQDYE